MILVDTSVWSLALRRTSGSGPIHPAAARLRRSIEDDEDVRLPGIVLQEVLSGVRHPEQLARLRSGLRGFPVEVATEEIHVRAAEIFNGCRAAGIAGSATDCLIAATADRLGARLLTVDGDYARMAGVVALDLVDWAA
jgi:predicted nucleic acid-binding protein